MNRLLPVLIFVAALTTTAIAASGTAEGSGLPWVDIVKQAINFGILVGILVYFLRKPLINFLKERREILIKSMEEAARANEEAKEKLARMEEKIAHLDREVEELNRTAQREAEDEFARIQALTQAEIERIKEQTTVAAEQVVKKAREELRQEAAELSIEAAEEMIAKTVTDEDQKRFVKESLREIKGAKK